MNRSTSLRSLVRNTTLNRFTAQKLLFFSFYLSFTFFIRAWENPTRKWCSFKFVLHPRVFQQYTGFEKKKKKRGKGRVRSVKFKTSTSSVFFCSINILLVTLVALMRCFRCILFIRLVYSMLSMLVRKEFCIFIILFIFYYILYFYYFWYMDVTILIIILCWYII